METLYKSISHRQITQVVEHKGYKFRIQASHTNGDWVAWLSVMTKEGKFERLENNEDLNFEFENLYFMDAQVISDERKKQMTDALEAVVPPFLEYIEKVY